MLILSVFGNEKHLLVLEKKMGRAAGKFSLKGACCYLSSTSFSLNGLGNASGCEADNNTLCPAFLDPGENTETVSHRTVIHDSLVREFKMTQAFKLFQYLF